MSLVKITSIAQLEALKAAPQRGVIVHFGATWCEPCTALNAMLTQTAGSRKDLIFGYVDAEAHGDIAEKEEVTSVPHVVYYRPAKDKDGNDAPGVERVAEVSGAKLPILKRNLDSIFGEKDVKSQYPSLEAYMKHLISKDKVVVFITGTPSRPRCGFTGRLIEMLEEKYKCDYTFFDVMGDEEVCEGLKKFSDWPTYPQLYVQGELVGGLDICREMDEAGELKAALKL